MKKSKQKKGDVISAKSKKSVFSKRHAARLKDLLFRIIIKEIS